MSKIGDFITREREKQDISIRGLSKITGISHSEINKIESGERATPSPYHLKMLADALGINQIECFKIAGYIDESQHENSSPRTLILSDFTIDEFNQIQNYASFIKSQRVSSQGEEPTVKKNNLKVASLFAGIGGICYGFKQAGADIVWANEIDKDACKTYRHNFGDEYR